MCIGIRFRLLLAEGLAVGALVLGGVYLVGTHQDPVQGTEVLIVAVIDTLLDSTFDALVGMAVHKNASFDIGFGISMDGFSENIRDGLLFFEFYGILWEMKYMDKL